MTYSLDGVAAMAGAQHGLVTRPQAHAAGCSDDVIGRLVRTGVLVGVHAGVYRVAGAPVTWLSRVMAAVLAAGPEALASHRTAAVLWRLEGFDRRATVDISVPADRRPRVEGAKVRRCGDLHLAQTAKRDAVPVTGLARTVLDLAGSERNLQIALRALDGARRRPHQLPWSKLEACADAHAGRRRKGLPAYEALLERRRGMKATDSNFESDLVDLLVAAGLPRPDTQYEVLGYRLDAAWTAPMVGLECHSKEFHLNEAAFERDPIRAGELAVAGWLVLHVTWDEFQRHPEQVVDRVRRALARR